MIVIVSLHVDAAGGGSGEDDEDSGGDTPTTIN
jgi:hypothetical protein